MPRMNRQMRELLHGHSDYLDAQGANPSDQTLQAILKEGITHENGGFFLKALLRKGGNARRKDFPDMTGYECFINHLHLDRIDMTIQPLKSAVEFGTAVREELKIHAYAGNKFKVIVVCNEDGCSVRFHLIRKNESWLAENIETYSEGILVMETDDASALPRKR
jgi:hypothetical protein